MNNMIFVTRKMELCEPSNMSSLWCLINKVDMVCLSPVGYGV